MGVRVRVFNVFVLRFTFEYISIISGSEFGVSFACQIRPLKMLVNVVNLIHIILMPFECTWLCCSNCIVLSGNSRAG